MCAPHPLFFMTIFACFYPFVDKQPDKLQLAEFFLPIIQNKIRTNFWYEQMTRPETNEIF